MRILFVSHSFPAFGRPLSNVGGMQRVAEDLYRALAAHPHVHLTPLLLETSWTLTGIRTGPFLFSLVRRIPRTVREEGIQVVLFSSMVTASVVTLVQGRISSTGAITAAIPVGRDLTLANPLYQRFVPTVLKKLDLILPISRATADAALHRGAPPERMRIVPCGVDFRRLDSTASKAEQRAALLDRLRSAGLRVADDSLLLLSVGRHQERKGFHWFVEAVMPVLPSRAVYLLAGSGPMTARIKAGVAAHGLGDRVHLLGQVPDSLLRTLYGGSDLFIMPNVSVKDDIEGFGVVTLEAGAAGLPVIASDLEGIRDAVQAGESGSLVRAGDVEGFVREIERLAQPSVLAEASRRSAEHVRSAFGWKEIVDSYLTIFRLRLGVSSELPDPAHPVE